MICLILLALLVAFSNLYLAVFKEHSTHSFRQSALASFILILFFVAASTELLGFFNLINTWALCCAWILLNIFLVLWSVRLYRQTGLGLVGIWKLGGTAAISFTRRLGTLTQITLCSLLLMTFVVCVTAPPNNMDSMSYHLSRLGYWIQNGNVEHYPSHIVRAITFSPFSEYVHLHLYLLSDSDRFLQLLQWSCLVAILLYVSLIVGLFSKSIDALRFALCFAVTVPIIVLESMTTQNDLVAALFIIATVFYTFDYIRSRRWESLVLVVLSVTLGLMTKGTFIFYCAPFGLFLIVYFIRKRAWKTLFVAGIATVFLSLCINAPFWMRNYQLFGSPTGGRTGGNQNMYHTPAAILSSGSKHLFLHLGFVSPGDKYNTALKNGLLKFHELIGMPLDTEGMGMEFKMNKLNFNEDFAHNFLATWIFLGAVIILIAVRPARSIILYFLLSISSIVVFITFISYQAYGSRLHIPFFVLIAPAVGILYGSVPKGLSKGLIFLMWLNALPFALLSATHPLLSTKWFFTNVFPAVNRYIGMNIDPSNQLNLMHESILFRSKEEILWGDRWPDIKELVSFVDSIGPRSVGFYFEEASQDYAYQMVLRQKDRVFKHIAVDNPSKTLESKDFHPDCIVSEFSLGPVFVYNGKEYKHKWSRGGVNIYTDK